MVQKLSLVILIPIFLPERIFSRLYVYLLFRILRGPGWAPR